MYSLEEDAEDIMEIDEDRSNVRNGILVTMFWFSFILLVIFDCGVLWIIYMINCCCIFDGIYRSSWSVDADLSWEIQQMHQNAGRTFIESRNYEFLVYDLDNLLSTNSIGSDPVAQAPIEIQRGLYNLGKLSWHLSFDLYEPNNYWFYNINRCIKNQEWTEEHKLTLFHKLMIPERSYQEMDGLTHLLTDKKYVFNIKFKNKEAFFNYMEDIKMSDDGLRLARHHKAEAKKRKMFRNEVIKKGLFSTSPLTYRKIKKIYLK